MNTAKVDGLEVVTDGKRGPVVLMLHGWPDTRVLWDAQVAALRDRFRCVRFTLPGFEPGSARRATSLEEMLTLFDKVVDLVSPDRPVVLLLHDWGCFFGYQYAMLRPDRIERVIGSRHHRVAGMNYPYDIAWTGSHGSYRDVRSVELACPLLFIYGRRKPFMFHSPTWEAGVAAQAGCEVVAMDTGHWVMREQPAKLNDAILRWLP